MEIIAWTKSRIRKRAIHPIKNPQKSHICAPTRNEACIDKKFVKILAWHPIIYPQNSHTPNQESAKEPYTQSRIHKGPYMCTENFLWKKKYLPYTQWRILRRVTYVHRQGMKNPPKSHICAPTRNLWKYLPGAQSTCVNYLHGTAAATSVGIKLFWRNRTHACMALLRILARILAQHSRGHEWDVNPKTVIVIWYVE